MNNSKEILKGWKEKYQSTRGNYYLRSIFLATGELPDSWQASYLGDMTSLTGEKRENTELSFINIPNFIY